MRLRDLGPVNGALYVVDRILQRLSGSRAFLQRYYLVTQPVTETLRVPRRLGASLEVRIVERGAPALRTMPRPAAVLEDRYAQGSTCLAAYRADELVGFIWLCPGSYLEDEVRCRFVPAPPGAASWDYDLWVAPAERNGIAFMKLWSAAMTHLAGRGVRWSASRISAFAPGSLAAHRRMGAVTVGQAFFMVAFGAQAMLATIPPYLHFSVRNSRPTLRVEAPPQAEGHD
jgi:hypothetical protein